jgi:hypothetical protein
MTCDTTCIHSGPCSWPKRCLGGPAYSLPSVFRMHVQYPRNRITYELPTNVPLTLPQMIWIMSLPLRVRHRRAQRQSSWHVLSCVMGRVVPDPARAEPCFIVCVFPLDSGFYAAVHSSTVIPLGYHAFGWAIPLPMDVFEAHPGIDRCTVAEKQEARK